MDGAPATPGVESPAVDHLAFSPYAMRLGGAGVNLAKSIDSLDPNELARLTNAVTGQGAGVDTRPGLIALVNGGANIHSAMRLNDPAAGAFTRFWGMDGVWGRAAAGPIQPLEAGFSGDPLTMVPWQTEFNGASWMYVADRNKMRKASRTSVSQSIGIPKPPKPTSVQVAEILRKQIAAFDGSDGTAAANWTAYGTVASGGVGAAGLPILSDVVGVQGNAVNMLTAPGSATGGYISVMSVPKVLDLTSLPAGGGPVVSTDEDIIHIWIRTDQPTIVDEIRLYVVVSAFSAVANTIPGTNNVANTAAYMRAFRPSDYAPMIAGQETAVDAVTTVRSNQLLDDFSDPTVSSAPTPSTAAALGVGTWTSFGQIGLPVRKSDFTKIGSAGVAGTDWSTVTGIIIVVVTNSKFAVNVAFDDSYLTGGFNVDSSEPDALPFDYRVTNYDTTTGAESNPSDAMTDPNWPLITTGTIEALRQRIVIQPVASGKVSYVQRAYRRGGTISDTWYGPVGQSVADGGQIVDNTLDITALATGTVNLDHDQPVTTADANGNTVLAQAVPILFGPIEGYLFALGDPNRPGDVYWCKQFEPDHWPAANHETACPPSEQLMNGGKLTTSQGFAFSRERLYSIQVNSQDGTVTTSPTDCTEGLAGRWGMCVGPGGLFFWALDGIRVTNGGASKLLSDNLRPLFHGQAKNGYFPVDYTVPNALRLAIFGDDLWCGFQDTNGGRVWWIYSFTYNTWRFAQFSVPTGLMYSEPNTVGGLSGIIGATAAGKAYTHDGFQDDGTAINASARTGASDLGKPREEKLLGDLVVFASLFGATLTAQTFLNLEKVANVAQGVVGLQTYERYLFDQFGTTPQHAQSVSLDLSWTSMPAARPSVQQVILDVAIQPEITMNRATTWQPLNDKGESYLTGMWIDFDTGGTIREAILVEGLISGQPIAIASLSISSAAGRRQWFSWPAVHVDMVRLRPTGACESWMLFGQGWLSTPEPPRIAVWDTGFENLGDSYYTGLDLEIDTFGQTKTIDILVDNVVVSAGVPLLANGRSYKHITLPWGRGHIFRFHATDANPGLLYTHKWIVEAEPGEQTNWNQNFTIGGSRADKFLKGITLECDTFNQVKQVTIEVDGVVTSTQAVQANGRKVVQVAFPQVLGRVFRIFPTDLFPGRLYSMGWIFDEEPFQLTRFETQEQRHGLDSWHIPEEACIAYKSNDIVTLTLVGYGQNGTLLSTSVYTLASTAGVKAIKWVPFNATKGVLYKYIFTCPSGFWLYREESFVLVQPWPGGERQKQRPFGDDDLDPSRSMVDAVGAASRSGGELRGNLS